MKTKNDDYLFSEFNPVSSKEWKQKIQVDLKGLEYNETLVWSSPEGIDVKPFYNSDDLKGINTLKESKNRQWNICHSIYFNQTDISIENAKNLSDQGIDSIVFKIPESMSQAKIVDSKLIDKLSFLQFKPLFLSKNYIDSIFDIARNQGIPNQKIIVHTDIIGQLIRSGNWYSNQSKDFSELEGIINTTATVSVDLTTYQNAGATMVQQLAYGLSHINCYLNYLKNINKLRSLKSVHFQLAFGSNYFFEIAKIRALRLLWESINNLYKTSIDCVIHGIPTKRNKGIYDYNSNMLRTTTECMSGILGGVDFIENLAYDSLYNKSNEFGDRISRNQLLILRNESHFNEISSAADGSYYIESLTDQLAESALKLFKDLESKSNFIDHLIKGRIQKKIKESAELEQRKFDKEEIKSVGGNFHINKDDRMKDNLELYPFIKHKSRKTLIEPILEKRLLESIEKERLNNE